MRRLALLLLVLILAPSCALDREPGSAARGPLRLTARQDDWALRVFGRPPELVGVFKPYRGMDVSEMRVEHQKVEKTVLGTANVRCRQADSYVYGDIDAYQAKDADDYLDGAEVLHGVPSGLDPARSPTGERQFVFIGQSGSGVRAYREAEKSPRQVRVFVLPSGTWIISHGAVGQRLADVLAQDSAEPPALDSVPGSFMEQTRVVTNDNRRELASMRWVPELRQLDRVTAVGRIVYPMSRGQPALMGIKLVFADEDAAHDAADAARRDPNLRTKYFAGVELFHTTVVVKAWESS